MKYLPLINWLQVIYLVAVISFISFYYLELRPFKIDRYCRKVVAQQTLLDTQNPDPYSSYQQSLKSCLADKASKSLL